MTTRERPDADSRPVPRPRLASLTKVLHYGRPLVPEMRVGGLRNRDRSHSPNAALVWRQPDGPGEYPPMSLEERCIAPGDHVWTGQRPFVRLRIATSWGMVSTARIDTLSVDTSCRNAGGAVWRIQNHRAAEIQQSIGGELDYRVRDAAHMW